MNLMRATEKQGCINRLLRGKKCERTIFGMDDSGVMPVGHDTQAGAKHHSVTLGKAGASEKSEVKGWSKSRMAWKVTLDRI